MDLPERLSDAEVLGRRRDFLTYLAEEPAEKPAMVADLDHSRSTVDRAVRSLADAGFVERTPEGYVTTTAGRLALDRYEAFLADASAILDARPVANAVPPTLAPPASLLTAGTVETPAEYALFEALADELRSAERYRALLPGLSDARHLRLLREQVRSEDLDATLVTTETLTRRLDAEFPHLLADLLAGDGVTVYEAGVPEVGLLLVGEGSSTRLVVLAYDGGEVAGIVRTEDAESVEWATETFEQARAEATDVTETLREAAASPDPSQVADRRLPAPLRSQGFARVDETYFDNRTAVGPVTGLRAGLKLPEVAAGYAVERRYDDEETVTERLLARLDGGDTAVLLGPPGAGKSTVCKRVAYEWFDSQRGAVLYRESGRGQPVQNVDLLVETLRATPGETLLVVEDATRSESTAVFEAMAALDEDADVSVLLDSRRKAWTDAEDTGLSDDLESFRQRLPTVGMPAFGEADQHRVLDRFEAVTDGDISVPTDDLVGDVAASRDAGAVFVFFHRLAGYAEPLSGERGLSTLDEHVDRVRERLADAGDGVLDVGVLANALNAAGIGVTPAFLYALAPDGETGTVERAIDVLDGDVLFTDAGAGETYRTVHDAWSVTFLDRLLDAEDDAPERFGRGISAMLALADDADRRTAVADAIDGGADPLAAIARDPAAWADDMAAQVFELGQNYPKLGELFGTTEDSSLSLPAAASETTRLRVRVWRGFMNNWASRFEQAEAEFSPLVERLADPTTTEGVDPARGEIYARAHLGLFRARFRRSASEATEHGERAVAAYEAIGDDQGATEARLMVSYILGDSGDPEAAEAHVSAAMAWVESAEVPLLEATCRYALANHRFTGGETDAARTELTRSLDIAHEHGALRLEKQGAALASYIHRELGDLDRAEARAHRAIDIARRFGDAHFRISALVSLARCGMLRGRFADAEQYLTEARETGAEGTLLNTRLMTETAAGRLAGLRGETETAIETLESAIDTAREHGLDRQEVRARCRLGPVLLDAGDPAGALDQADRMLELSERLTGEYLVGQARRVEGLAHLETGDLDAAACALEEAVEHLEAADFHVRAARARHARGTVAREQGDSVQARECYEGALSVVREAGATRLALAVVDDLATVDDPEAWFETGAAIAADAGFEDREQGYRDRAAAAGGAEAE